MVKVIGKVSKAKYITIVSKELAKREGKPMNEKHIQKAEELAKERFAKKKAK